MDITSIPWDQVSIGVALVIGVIILGRKVFKLIESVVDRMDKMQDKTLTFLGNHMSSNTEAQMSTAAALKDMADAVEEMADQIRQKS